ncbi:TldD/PmbA family protein [Bacillaceae bacterium W0354]
MMNMLDFKDLLFEKGKDAGFTDMELSYEKEHRFNCSFDQGEVDHFQSSEVLGVSFRGLFDGKMGYTFTEKIDDTSVDFLLKNAKENAVIVEEEDQDEIYEGDQHYEELNFSSQNLKTLSNQDKINLIKQLDEYIYATDERVIGTNFFQLISSEMESGLYNTKGLSLHDEKNFLAFHVMVIVKENDVIKSAMTVHQVENLAQTNVKAIAEEVVEEAVSQLSAKNIPDDEYKVILRNNAAAGLINTFTPIFSANNAQKGLSRLKEKVGKKIAGENITFIDDPFRRDGLGSRTFDAEGVASQKLAVVEKGKLNTLLHNRRTAKKDGVQSTGHAHKTSYKDSITVAPTNFVLEPGEKSYDQLVSSLDEGVIVTDLSGLHSGTNLISGDFSLAATGYYVKNGKVQYATNQMTIAGNFFELLNQVEEVGSDLEMTLMFGGQNGYVGSASLLVNGLSVTVE